MDTENTVKKRYSCSKCHMGFGHKSTLTNHFRRKFSCVEGDTSTPVCITNLFSNCKYCHEQVKTETCINFMKKHLENCMGKTMAPTVVNNININIQINAYNDPSFSHLEYSEKLALNRIQILHQLNFNPNVPENHNIFYIKETNMYRFYSSNYKQYVDVPYEKLLIKLSSPLDKAQEYLVNTGLLTIEEKKTVNEKMNINYGEIEKANVPYYAKIIKDCNKIPEHTRKLYFDRIKDQAEEEVD